MRLIAGEPTTPAATTLAVLVARSQDDPHSVTVNPRELYERRRVWPRAKAQGFVYRGLNRSRQRVHLLPLAGLRSGAELGKGVAVRGAYRRDNERWSDDVSGVQDRARRQCNPQPLDLRSEPGVLSLQCMEVSARLSWSPTDGQPLGLSLRPVSPHVSSARARHSYTTLRVRPYTLTAAM